MQLAFVSELLETARQFATIENEKLPPGLTEEAVVSTMRDRAQRSREFMAKTNALISEHLVPVFEHPETLSDAQADIFTDLAIQLAEQGKPLDEGLSYPLHEALLRRAKAKDDIDRTIFHLYHCGFINLQWSMNLFIDDAYAQYAEAIGYLDQYFTLEKKETRHLLNRCLANHYVAISTMRQRNPDYAAFSAAVDKAVAFWNDPKVRALDPDFTWDAFIANSHQNTCSWLDCLRDKCKDDKFLAQRVYESTQALYGADFVSSSADTTLWPIARMAYCINAARYHNGMITAREMSDSMRLLYNEARDDDYSPEGIFRMLHISAYMYEYMKRIPGIPQAVLRAEERSIRDRVWKYCNALPNDASRRMVSRSSTSYMTGLMGDYDLEDSINFLLELTTFNHLPTHVHSIMTGLLMRAIAQYFMDVMPEKMTGIFEGVDTVADVQKHKDSILTRVQLAGLSHDAGKFIYIQTFSQYSRKLTDREFQVIREHTGQGCRMIDNLTTQDDCISDVIRGHHKSYDGKSGYPDDFDNTASQFRFIIDIASVADSIDAATDNIGRSYANQKTLQSVIDEIVACAGTRYSPVVATALMDSRLHSQLNDILLRQRRKAYYTVYQSMQARDTHQSLESGQ